MKLNGHHVDQMLHKWLGIRHVSRDGYLGILIDSGAESETLDHADVHESTRYIGRQGHIDVQSGVLASYPNTSTTIGWHRMKSHTESRR